MTVEQDCESWYVVETSLMGADDWSCTGGQWDTLEGARGHRDRLKPVGFELRIVKKTLLCEVVE